MFYFLKDGDKIMNYFKELLPFKEEVKNKFITRFKEITTGVIYGSIVVGIVQGIIAGIGYYLFGIEGTFVLTLISIFLSILPIGSWPVWIPLVLNLMYNGESGRAIGLAFYGFFIISYVDNILKPYIVGNKIKLSPIIAVLGMLGGAMLFGFIGLFIGPIILSYLILFLDFYRSGMKELF